ncbi:hypothetical protein KOR42_34000 [Thalassoglobus neptunius]|uniref:Uncharacterized protein n=1 Tax=Thalassoglobus neptunius TaxID=1938619 RepID=A0A5C5WNW8_9PLAN|nr:hypothetical protein [Thalassoglobus neptunius]TWT51713.1 hypothetical protein KOR42_34000 [Thalassoglobus neptunius]
MPHPKISGFITRASAQRKFNRSKASFIRDVDLAFERKDSEFLSHFRVGLNDGSELAGEEATKARLHELQSRQPRWYIELKFLESGYWQSPDTLEEAEPSKSNDSVQTSSEASFELRHQLDLAEQQIATQDKTIHRLEDDKTFLQNELENRRGEIDKLRGFFESVGDAADSTAKLRSGAQGDHNVVDSPQNLTANSKKGSITRQYLPTFHKFLSKFRSA